MADQFVRVRLERIENSDLNLFEFDYDLTLMVFFLNADEQIYGRYGGRDADSAEARMSLAGLRYSMKAALDTHRRPVNPPALEKPREPKFIREFAAAKQRGRCIHCHRVKEIVYDQLMKDGKWSRDLILRYPPPDNLGFELEVDRGNVVKRVTPDSPAARVGLRASDTVTRLGAVPIHSFGDAQFALDQAPRTGSVDISWQRDGRSMTGKIALPAGWRKTDISWRSSMGKFVPSARLYGRDLTPKEKKALGLDAKQLAFRQNDRVYPQAQAAGVQEGDIILGLDNRKLEVDSYNFLRFVSRNYLVGDRVTVNLIRNGKRLALPMTLRPFN